MTADSRSAPGAESLQFDVAQLPADGQGASITCTACRSPIRAYYYEANGSVVCARCKQAATLAAEGGGSRAMRIGRAGVFGTGAADAGAALYYAVARLTGYEIGLIAIAVGYMVGYAVRTGSRGRGGWRYQMLALGLTQLAIGMAYFTQGVDEMRQSKETAKQAAATTAGTSADVSTASTHQLVGASGAGTSTTQQSADSVGAATPSITEAAAAGEKGAERPGAFGVVIGVVALVGFALALPLMAGFSEFPQHAIGLVIVGIALHQAWVLNRRVPMKITGPYKVGAAPATEAAPAGLWRPAEG